MEGGMKARVVPPLTSLPIKSLEVKHLFMWPYALWRQHPNVRHARSGAMLAAMTAAASAFGRLPRDVAIRQTDGATIIRLSSRSPAEYVRRMPCARAPNAELHAFAKKGRKEWRSPPIHSLCCFPAHSECFRAVFDGRIQMQRPGHNRTMASRIPKDSTFFTEQIRGLLADEFGVRGVTLSSSRSRAYFPDDWDSHDQWQELHADYYQSRSYIFSSVLFLGEEDSDEERRVGGETGLADALVLDQRDGRNATGLSKGLVVEPRRGRLLVFTGGGENYHAPLPVVQGRRTTFHAWFKCDCRS